eukprot:1138052-Pelagomonas_calceolata.AAC.7
MQQQHLNALRARTLQGFAPQRATARTRDRRQIRKKMPASNRSTFTHGYINRQASKHRRRWNEGNKHLTPV